MTDKEIEEVYQIIKDYQEKYLKKYGVKLPKLKDTDRKYTRNALVLIYLAKFYPSTVLVTKQDLTAFIRKFYPETNDVQQARHLGAQSGWFISAGGRDNVHVKKSGEYQLITLERPYPNFKGHRIETTGNWENIKQQYGNRCATCGSEEGKKNIHYPNTITKLQKAHIDPFKSLTKGTIIPQCQKCNRAYKDKTPMNSEYLNTIIHGDTLQVLSGLEDNSIDLVLTDPPYFLDKMDDRWDEKKVASTKYHHVVKSLPAGMKFDREQGKNFYEWYYKISKQILRVLKPGGFFFSFSSPRLYHRMVSAIDDAGLLIRDCFIWLYTQNQPKAMSLNHFIENLDEDKETKEGIKKQLSGWKTPQIKSCFEPIVMAQKEPQGTFLENFRKFKVGLLNTTVRIGQDMFPSNVVSTNGINEIVDKCFLISKPDKKEKGDFNLHRTVKPLSLCEYIISLTTYSHEAVILDPFAGSGTTLVAAKKSGRKFIGIDINKEYIEIAKRRIKSFSEGSCGEVGSSRYNVISEEKQLRILEKKATYKKSSKVRVSKIFFNNL